MQSPQVVEVRTPFGKEQAEPSDAISTLLPRAWLDADLTDLIQEQACCSTTRNIRVDGCMSAYLSGARSM